jgi:hypothetical protein
VIEPNCSDLNVLKSGRRKEVALKDDQRESAQDDETSTSHNKRTLSSPTSAPCPGRQREVHGWSNVKLDVEFLHTGTVTTSQRCAFIALCKGGGRSLFNTVFSQTLQKLPSSSPPTAPHPQIEPKSVVHSMSNPHSFRPPKGGPFPHQINAKSGVTFGAASTVRLGGWCEDYKTNFSMVLLLQLWNCTTGHPPAVGVCAGTHHR